MLKIPQLYSRIGVTVVRNTSMHCFPHNALSASAGFVVINFDLFESITAM